MSLFEAAFKLLGLSEVLLKWHGVLKDLNAAGRERVAAYAEEIAASIARAAAAADRLGADGLDARQRRRLATEFAREIGRLRGYVEDVTVALRNHLDGRKIAGVKRRLETLDIAPGDLAGVAVASDKLVARLMEAEGYMRALADRLRA